MENGKTISVYTLGCRVNQYESLAICDRARDEGFEVVEWTQNADIGIVNTCALTSLAEAKTRNAVRAFAKRNPNSKIALTGCYAQTNPEILRKLPNVKWICGNDGKISIAKLIKDFPEGLLEDGIKKFSLPKEIDEKVLSGNSFFDDRANLKIQDGCDNACGYCIIPRARGLPRSRNFSVILEEAQNLAERGVREIILTGINLAKFSSPDGGLVELVDRLSEMRELKRLRFGSIEPAGFPFEAIAERMADDSHILAPHFHISAQSLSDKVLQNMRRNYSTADFFKTLEKIFTICPEAGIGSDFICGYPGEGSKEFEETKKNLLSCGLSYAHVFTFSPREKTLAKNMPEQNAQTAKERAKELRNICKKIHSKFLNSQTGKLEKILLENSLSCGKYLGHTGNYARVEVKNLPKNAGKNFFKNRLAKAILREVSSETLLADFINFAD